MHTYLLLGVVELLGDVVDLVDVLTEHLDDVGHREVVHLVSPGELQCNVGLDVAVVWCGSCWRGRMWSNFCCILARKKEMLQMKNSTYS